jgi:hypothetical protein
MAVAAPEHGATTLRIERADVVGKRPPGIAGTQVLGPARRAPSNGRPSSSHDEQPLDVFLLSLVAMLTPALLATALLTPTA